MWWEFDNMGGSGREYSKLIVVSGSNGVDELLIIEVDGEEKEAELSVAIDREQWAQLRSIGDKLFGITGSESPRPKWRCTP